MIKNGIGDKSRPLTIIKLLVHHVGFLLSSAVTNNTKQKNRKSIRDFLKNIFIVPTIFNGNENKNMFGWYLLLLRYQPNLSEYYKNLLLENHKITTIRHSADMWLVFDNYFFFAKKKYF